jgi:hypothetical protein
MATHYPAPPGSQSGGYFPEPVYRFNETPEEWRKHAQEPWRILFTDLEWAQPGKND